MIVTDIKTLDLSKYKRFVAIGCSFTNWRWPTWANILHKEMTDAEFYNAGTGGAGNQYIFTQLSQYINSWDLQEDDFIAVMWSGMYREDRYIHGRHQNWLTPGSIYSQDVMDTDYIKNFICVRGLAVRDYALIDSACRIMNTIPATCITTTSIPLTLEGEYSGNDDSATAGHNLSDLYSLYNFDQYMLPNLMLTQCPNGWPTDYSYTLADGEQIRDYHPSLKGYKEYLEKIGFKLSADTKEWVRYEHERLSQLTHQNEFHEPDAKLIL